MDLDGTLHTVHLLKYLPKGRNRPEKLAGDDR